MTIAFEGSYLIPAPRQDVWDALNNPDVLARCIPGCESLTEETPGAFRARVALKVGVVSATFDGRVTLQPLSPPEKFTLSGEASGGLAGFATGGADITLDAVSASETRLAYYARADIGGRIAMVGHRLIQSVATSIADKFFANFARELGASDDVRKVEVPVSAAPVNARDPAPVAPSVPMGKAIPVTTLTAFAAGIGVGIASTVAAVLALSVAF